MFQHTAAQRRLPYEKGAQKTRIGVSTHSRAEAAAGVVFQTVIEAIVSTHSRAEAAAKSM